MGLSEVRCGAQFCGVLMPRALSMLHHGEGKGGGIMVDKVGIEMRIGLKMVLKRGREGSEAAVPGAAVRRERWGVKRWAAMRRESKVKAAVWRRRRANNGWGAVGRLPMG